jgi:uncharacterized protein (DUF1800 family)
MLTDTTLRALNRFGLGARLGERARIGDAQTWLRRQLAGGAPTLPAPEDITADSIADALRALRMVAQGDQRERQEARRRLVKIGIAESRAALTSRITTDRPYVERLVAFWSNHLCISASAKLQVAPLAGSYERDVIRPHVLGRFEDMVLASAHHPAMLIYLDNFQSIGPGSQGAQVGRAGARRGLNENYARELLELHTLGVNGGYTQQDVLELARALTGWTVAGLAQGRFRVTMRARAGGRVQPLQNRTDGPLGFEFHDRLHEPGIRTILGVRYDAAGVQQGERAIRSLCRHPSTANFVATKLVAHFVSDNPPAAAVQRVAQVFRESDGDLRAVAGALIDLPEAWTDGNRKFRTPQDWLVAVLRAFNAEQANDNIVPVLRQLRHPLWSPQSPKGFGDTTQEWADPDSLLNRAELARTLTRRVITERVDPAALLEVVDVNGADPLRKLLANTSIPADERVALAIAGPAFQWR